MLENTSRKDRKYVGKDVPKIDTVEKVTGQALYTGDLAFAGLLHGKALRSPHARAKIKSIDTTKASNLPGVHAVLTGKDLDYRVGLYLVDKYILAKDTIRHFGEAIAAVAAETPAIAQQAVDLIEIEYEVLTPFLDPKKFLIRRLPLFIRNLANTTILKPFSRLFLALTLPTTQNCARVTSKRALKKQIM